MNVEIADRLARRRREAGYSQESLAEKLGVSRQAVSKWERSESSPDTDNLIALAQLYGVSLDDLLYVDESVKEDVAFEAADRAAERQVSGDDADVADAAGAGRATGTDEPGSSGTETHEWGDGFGAARDKGRVNIGPGGVHIVDGDDYVHVSWKDGVHVRDAAKGDEVHVGWDGIHMKDGRGGHSSRHWNDDWRGFFSGDYEECDARVYTADGFEGSLDEAKEHFGKKYAKGRIWRRFPFPLVAILAYVLLGLFFGYWGRGLFVFFAVPVYYMIGHAVQSRRLAPLLEGLYPLGSFAWFLWMACVLGAPHPAWVVFLTIPLVEWAIFAVAQTYRKRKGLPDKAPAFEVKVEVEPGAGDE